MISLIICHKGVAIASILDRMGLWLMGGMGLDLVIQPRRAWLYGLVAGTWAFRDGR